MSHKDKSSKKILNHETKTNDCQQIEVSINESEEDLLKLVYEEAWRQYTHEDQMAEQRDSKYLTILSIIFSALGVMLSILFSNVSTADISRSTNSMFFMVIVTALVITITISIIIFILLVRWDEVTTAGKAYSDIRLSTAAEIENKLNMTICLAKDQDRKINSVLNKSKKTSFEGFSATHSIIIALKVVDVIMFVAAFCFLIVILFF